MGKNQRKIDKKKKNLMNVPKSGTENKMCKAGRNWIKWSNIDKKNLN